MSVITVRNCPDREPDIDAPAAGHLYKMNMWVKEGIVGFLNNNEDWNFYTLFTHGGRSFTAKQYLELMIEDEGHPHHKEALDYEIEKSLLAE